MHTYMYMYNELNPTQCKGYSWGKGRGKGQGRRRGRGRGREKNSGCLYNIYLTHITPEVISALESFAAPLEAEV